MSPFPCDRAQFHCQINYSQCLIGSAESRLLRGSVSSNGGCKKKTLSKHTRHAQIDIHRQKHTSEILLKKEKRKSTNKVHVFFNGRHANIITTVHSGDIGVRGEGQLVTMITAMTMHKSLITHLHAFSHHAFPWPLVPPWTSHEPPSKRSNPLHTKTRSTGLGFSVQRAYFQC